MFTCLCAIVADRRWRTKTISKRSPIRKNYAIKLCMLLKLPETDSWFTSAAVFPLQVRAGEYSAAWSILHHDSYSAMIKRGCCTELHVLASGTINAAGNDSEYVLVMEIFALSLHVQLLPNSLIIYFWYDSDNFGIAQQSSGMFSQAGRLASSLHRFSPDKLQACDVSVCVQTNHSHWHCRASMTWIHPSFLLPYAIPLHREKGGEGDCCSKSPLPHFCVYYAICFRVLIRVLTDLYVYVVGCLCVRVCELDITWWNKDATVSQSEQWKNIVLGNTPHLAFDQSLY